MKFLLTKGKGIGYNKSIKVVLPVDGWTPASSKTKKWIAVLLEVGDGDYFFFATLIPESKNKGVYAIDFQKISQLIDKMADWEAGSPKRINHYLKVWGYAKTIGELEGLDEFAFLTGGMKQSRFMENMEILKVELNAEYQKVLQVIRAE